MGVRYVMVGCTGDHTTDWITRRGDEVALEVTGPTNGTKLELVMQAGDEFKTQDLHAGINPLPPGPFKRFRVSKRHVLRSAPEVSTTVRITTR